jgi:AcrR family transcriptional regulator
MSMKKNSPIARAPRRQRGMERVAALIEAAIAVFAEKGYAAATMTEIAARAGAPIGSLYQFFPNKELIADALLQRYLELAVNALSRLESVAAAHSPAALAQGLLRVFVDLKTERAAILSLLDALRLERAAIGTEFRAAMLAHLQKILHLLAPDLTPTRAANAAITILQQMKAAAELGTHAGPAAAGAAGKELTRMLTLYLTDLGDGAAPTRSKAPHGTSKIRR